LHFFTGWSIYFNRTLYISAFGGTSCVSPAFAGYLGLVNKTFTRNPLDLFYQAYASVPTTAFKDITTGSNNSLNHGVNVFNARVGYDQCTGVGSIQGTILANYLHTNN
jgi:kumamolisin